MSSYRILDEPRPSGLARLVVDPMWPLLACMLVSGSFGLAWLAFNGLAVGSVTRIREITICVLGILASVGSFVLLAALDLDKPTLRYAYLGVIVLKLAAAYWASGLQQRSVELFEYFGGKKQAGMFVLLAGMFLLRPMLTNAAKDSHWLFLLVI
ncbi:hypothetical protein C7S18_17795 [Ahniella affigens]|uniref:Uncharacterized protein n=1 Tax=Ahniella affigens TaxID=2021234 RepID=A0A2P1PVP2_9GAMM|nr:hypothetical protein [Ahniella affigens]AVP98918.1 hypothetical protein C7S18_17795 [Ahniella affigens]